MGLWFFSLALSNLCAGLVATVSVKFKNGDLDFIIPGLPGFFLLLSVAALVTGTVLVALTPLLRKMMRGIH
jgi:dipeptide/tripeptide permease